MLTPEKLYRLSDLVQMELITVEQHEDRKLIVRGEQDLEIDTGVPGGIPITATIVSSFIKTKEEEVGVLIEVCGDLMILATDHRKSNVLSAIILDRTKIRDHLKGPVRLFERFEVKDYKGAVKLIKSACTAAFVLDGEACHDHKGGGAWEEASLDIA